MYAVIETGGKQYRVSEGEVVHVEHLARPVGEQVAIASVHLVADGERVQVGQPDVEGAQVRATVVGEGRGRKVVAFKKKRRKGYRRKVGHRQSYTALRIDEIVSPGAKKSSVGKKKGKT
ncbi:MAG: 50S ribosomal protein L21 [Acidobacteriota bacterium]